MNMISAEDACHRWWCKSTARDMRLVTFQHLLPQAAAFKVFQLEQPSAQAPYIKGLLDPCTNSLTAPNIPAQKLYDKQVWSDVWICTWVQLQRWLLWL